MKRQKEKKIKKKRTPSKRHPVLIITTVCALIFSACAGAFAVFQMNRYEEGILDVCATQQDAYVQLVLDQINLKQNRDDEEIITDILETLDASSNKYWTFSKEQSMLFVKDVLETNRYKGFTTATYYISDSAQEFLDSIQLNLVSHSNIEIDGVGYVASGVAFSYNGGTYRLCLLTNRSVLFDNNKFLGAKTELGILIAVLMMLLVIVPMLFASWVWKLQRGRDEQDDVIATLSSSLTKLNKMLSEQDLHDTRRNTWDGETIEGFMKKLKERDAYPSTLAKIRCKDETEARDLLRKATCMLDKTVLRFVEYDEELEIVSFLFVKSDVDTAVINLQPLMKPTMVLEEMRLLVNSFGQLGVKRVETEEGGVTVSGY